MDSRNHLCDRVLGRFATPSQISTMDGLPEPVGERHFLEPEQEFRIEVPFQPKSTFKFVIQKGTCELNGIELAERTPYTFTDGGLKLALYTWHGCVIDFECDINRAPYIANDTVCNTVYVNTHAQLEALRDTAQANGTEGPRVLVCGPKDFGKTSIVKTLVAYAVKVGRVPMCVDLDPSDNWLTIPGTLSACPIRKVEPEEFATMGIPIDATPLTLWHGDAQPIPDLFQAQVTAIAENIDKRLANDAWEQSSGIIVNTNGWIEDDGFKMLWHSILALRISVVLVVGHDSLYHMIQSELDKTDFVVKNIKIPRCDGTMMRSDDYKRLCQSRSMRRYLYGGSKEVPTNGATKMPRVDQLTPFLSYVKLSEIKLYKFSTMSLSKSLLPVAGTQATETIQADELSVEDASLNRKVLAVCHPKAVERYEASGLARDLCQSSVAGFCMVERVVIETGMMQVLCPCAGALPSLTFIVGNLTWIE